MKFVDFKQKFKKFIVLTQNQIRLVDPDFNINRLGDWQKKGYLKKIIKGYYIFADQELNEDVCCHIANQIYKPSYISTYYALRYYNLIPEAVYQHTSISSRQTRNFSTDVGRFSYRHVKPELFFGYTQCKHLNFCYYIADLEKAVLDFLYFDSGLETEDDYVQLRVSPEEFFRACNLDKLKIYLAKFENKSLEARVEKFLKWIKYV